MMHKVNESGVDYYYDTRVIDGICDDCKLRGKITETSKFKSEKHNGKNYLTPVMTNRLCERCGYKYDLQMVEMTSRQRRFIS